MCRILECSIEAAIEVGLDLFFQDGGAFDVKPNWGCVITIFRSLAVIGGICRFFERGIFFIVTVPEILKFVYLARSIFRIHPERSPVYVAPFCFYALSSSPISRSPNPQDSEIERSARRLCCEKCLRYQPTNGKWWKSNGLAPPCCHYCLQCFIWIVKFGFWLSIESKYPLFLLFLNQLWIY